MVSYVRTSNLPYRMTLGLEDVNEICNKEKNCAFGMDFPRWF